MKTLHGGMSLLHVPTSYPLGGDDKTDGGGDGKTDGGDDDGIVVVVMAGKWW